MRTYRLLAPLRSTPLWGPGAVLDNGLMCVGL